MNKPAYAKYMSSAQLYLIKKIKGVEHILLLKRKGGWGDKLWDAGVSGHIDEKENPIMALLHESKEELNIIVKEKDLKFICVICKNMQPSNDIAYYNFSFFTNKWTGDVINNEPEKAYEIKWFPINKLPKELVPDRKIAIKNLINKNYFTNYNWKNNGK